MGVRPHRKVCSNCIWCTYNYYGGFPPTNGDYTCHKFHAKVTENDPACGELVFAKYKAIRESNRVVPRRAKDESMDEYRVVLRGSGK